MQKINAILLTFHVGPGAGCAIDSLLTTFIQMARRLVANDRSIHITFPRMIGLEQRDIFAGIGNLVESGPTIRDKKNN